jgi:hypothetical protein
VPTPVTETPSLSRPLRTPIFRNLLIADVMSDIGTFMQTVGAAWLMVSLGAGPMYVGACDTVLTHKTNSTSRDTSRYIA